MAAGVGFAVYLAGFLLSFWLPEPKRGYPLGRGRWRQNCRDARGQRHHLFRYIGFDSVSTHAEEAERPFRCPLVPIVPILGIVMCLLLMFSLPAANWARLLGWLAIGLVIYIGYSRHHSFMRKYLTHEITAHGISPGGALQTDIDPKTHMRKPRK